LAIDALESGLPERSTSLSIRVDCVARAGRRPPDDRILAIGGAGPDGARWRLTKDEAIAAMERGRRFYLERPKGHRVDVVVVPGFGRKHIRTEADRRGPGLLLDLPECE
jgi:hypothetical protein